MDIEKLIERLRTESLYADKASLDIMDLCMDAATALSTLQAENEKLRDELREMVQAKREGRCVVPLCKVGDTVYAFSQMRDKRILPFIKEYEITSIRINKRLLSYYHEKDGFIKIMKQSDFGKTVFLTHAEAEAALRREQDG